MQTFNNILLTASLLLFSVVAWSQDSFEIFVSSRNTNSVKRYDATGNFLGDFVTPGSGGLSLTQDVLFHPNGSLLVTGRGNTAIKQYDGTNGTFTGDFTTGYSLDNPTKMSIGPDSLIYVSQWGVQNKVVRFDLQGQFVDEFTETGVPNGCDHAWDTDGNLYVSSYGNGQNGQIHIFDSQGKYLGLFAGSGPLQGPVGQWFAENGHLFVTDYTPGRVLEFDADGNYLGVFITGLTHVEGHVFDPEGYIYLCDWSENIIRKYDPDGLSLGNFATTGGMLAPNALVIRPSNVSAAGISSNESLLFSISPNPSDSLVHIRFELPEAMFVNLTILDAVGKTEEILRNEWMTSGKYDIVWRGKSAGVYYGRLEAKDHGVLTNTIIIK